MGMLTMQNTQGSTVHFCHSLGGVKDIPYLSAFINEIGNKSRDLNGSFGNQVGSAAECFAFKGPQGLNPGLVEIHVNGNKTGLWESSQIC